MTQPAFVPRRLHAPDAPGGTDALRRTSPVAVDGDAPATGARRVGREAGALLLVVAALYVSLALGSFEADPLRPERVGGDWVGPVGAALAGALAGWVGVAAWFVPFELGVLAAPLLGARRSKATVQRIAGDVVVVVVAAALAHVLFPAAKAFGAVPAGGGVGELFGELMRQLFSSIGSVLVGGTIILLILIGRADFSFIASVDRARALAARLEGWASGKAVVLADAWGEARAEKDPEPPPPLPRRDAAEALVSALADEIDVRDEAPDEPVLVAISREDRAARAELPPEVAPAPAEPAPARSARAKKAREKAAPEPVVLEPTPEPFDVPTPSPIPPELPASTPVGAAPVRAAPRSRKAKDDDAPIIDTQALEALKPEPTRAAPPRETGGFRLPNTELLEPPTGGRLTIDEARLAEMAALLEKTLSDYGVSGKVEQIQPGPTVTTFEVVPAAGTKVSKVASLADDLALGLSRKVRIIAPIPGKNRIGFEIPNDKRLPVCLRELVEDRRFAEMKDPLPCVLGRDIVGAPFFADLSSMPHVIVAGATGAGKSVGLNVMLVSLLFRRTPAELRMLMVDPKVVELAPFDGIPHMLLPVVTDMKQAANAMKWAVDEMERRYQLFANAGTKNIGTYNGWVERVHRGEAKPPKPPARVTAVAPDGSDVEVAPAKDASDVDLPEKLPFIVIVIDEFADLMMQQGKDVESAVARLAQKARAAGMHVILATQRPSVDVITGMIKANFPTRIAFRVAQKVDSRTILDEQGAEHLLGRGDMLVKMNGQNDTRRVQGPFCTEEEVQRVCDHLRAQGSPVYDESILKPRDEEGEAPDEDAEQDAMYDLAVRVVAETRRCSTSWIQRKLGIGYNRAAKIVETMEKRGVIGPPNGAKDREVLIQSF